MFVGNRFGNYLDPCGAPAFRAPLNTRHLWLPRRAAAARAPQEPPLESATPTPDAATQDQGNESSTWLTLAQIVLVPLWSLVTLFGRR